MLRALPVWPISPRRWPVRTRRPGRHPARRAQVRVPVLASLAGAAHDHVVAVEHRVVVAPLDHATAGGHHRRAASGQDVEALVRAPAVASGAEQAHGAAEAVRPAHRVHVATQAEAAEALHQPTVRAAGDHVAPVTRGRARPAQPQRARRHGAAHHPALGQPAATAADLHAQVGGPGGRSEAQPQAHGPAARERATRRDHGLGELGRHRRHGRLWRRGQVDHDRASSDAPIAPPRSPSSASTTSGGSESLNRCGVMAASMRRT